MFTFKFKSLFSIIRKHIHHVSWASLLTILFIHAATTFVLLSYAKESALIALDTFVYYYIVTTSTVGFGDFSPTTPTGKLVVSVIQIPFGLALFGAVLGKVGQTITHSLRRHMTGENNFSQLQHHIIIFGWNAKRTPKIIEHILGDKKRQVRTILLCVQADISHPFADNTEVAFAKVSSYIDEKELARVGIKYADRVIVDGQDDNETFTTTLRLSKLVNEHCHIGAHFEDEVKVQMLRDLCPNVECSVSQSVQQLVRSIQDPGASRIVEELLSTLEGDTQFSLQVPDNNNPIEFRQLFNSFKQQYEATVIGVADNRIGDGMVLNPAINSPVNPGQFIHYIARNRLDSIDINWSSM